MIGVFPIGTTPVGSAEQGSGAADGAMVFRARVMIDGVDQTSRIAGDIRIEAEEGNARVADLVFVPDAGSPIYLPAWTGKSVVISVGDYSSGAMANEVVRFTGITNLPKIDLNGRVIRLSCTDDLQGRISSMSKASLATLIGGYHSPAVFNNGASIWGYAQDRLSTVAGNVDLSPTGTLRMTPWAAKPVADLTFNADRLGEGSVSVDMAERSELTNRVDIEFGYRFPRVKSEGYSCIYDALAPDGFADYIIDNRYIPTREQVTSAIEAAGGTIETVEWDALPTSSVTLVVGGAPVGVWIPNPATDPFLCTGWTASVSFSYAQDTDETHKISVTNAASIAAVGAVKKTMSGALVGEYADTTSVETTTVLWKNSITSIPPLNTAPVVDGYTNAAEVTLSADTNRAAANNAMQTLIAIAMTDIARSHRLNTVKVRVPLNAALDIDKTVMVACSDVTARGKVRRFVDTINHDSGVCVTDFEIAISAIAGVGITHPATPVVAPTGTAATVSAALTPPVIVFKNATAEDHSLTITFPGVEDTERDRAKPVITSTYAAPITEDIFGVSL